MAKAKKVNVPKVPDKPVELSALEDYKRTKQQFSVYERIKQFLKQLNLF